LSAQVEAGIEIDYFNNRIFEYEPLLEKWNFLAKVIFLIHKKKENYQINSDKNPVTSIKLESNEIANLNLSLHFAETIGHINAALARFFRFILFLKNLSECKVETGRRKINASLRKKQQKFQPI
jgi:hypothetical protein